MKKRFVNIRIPVILALALLSGIITGFYFVYKNIELIWLICVAPTSLIPLIIFTAIKRPKFVIFTLLAVILFIVGFFSCISKLENYKLNEIDTSNPHYVCGTVVEKNINSYGETIIIDNATVDNTPFAGKILVKLKVGYGEFCDIGYRVEFFTTVTKFELFPYGELNYYAQNDVRYSCAVYGGMKSQYRFSLFGSIRKEIRNALYENLDDDTAAICYAMLIGETNDMDERALENFRFGGVAHIFAVSGLHIGLVYAILGGILKKLRANKYAAALICISAIIFYAGICGFTLSSVRAVIMCAISILTRLIHVKRDGLNMLAAAVLVILFINPLNLFAIGFQLSVCAVGGIFMFSSKCGNFLRKIKIPKKIADTAGASLGATAGTLPVMMAGFGYLSGAGILLNIIVVPVISLMFEIMFVAAIAAALMPPLGIILTYAALPLQAVISFLATAGFENVLITGFGSGLFPLLYCFVFLASSDKLNLGAIYGSIFFAITLVVATGYVLIATFTPLTGHKIAISANAYGGCVLFKGSSGNVLVITDSASTSRITDLLNDNYSLNLDGVILLGDENCAVNYDRALNCDNVYISDFYVPVQPYRDIKFNYAHKFQLSDLNFEFTDGYNLTVTDNGIKICISCGDIPYTDCDLLISENINYDFEMRREICNAKNTVYFSKKGLYYNIAEYGKISFFTENGILKQR